MFTGIIHLKGKIESITKNLKGYTEICFVAQHNWNDITLGESIAFDGICLSIIGFDACHLKAELSPETLEKCLFEKYPERSVNIERSLSLGDKMGGHMVQGHVDGTVETKQIIKENDRYEVIFRFPVLLSPFFIEKGSVAINGVSLTIFEISDETFKTAVIPDTLKKTNISELVPGSLCHVETDMTGRYLYRFYSLQKKT